MGALRAKLMFESAVRSDWGRCTCDVGNVIRNRWCGHLPVRCAVSTDNLRLWGENGLGPTGGAAQKVCTEPSTRGA